MRKMDEMERRMNDKSVRTSWAFGLISLLIMNIYTVIESGEMHWSFSIMLGMLIIYRLTYVYEQYKMGDRTALSAIFWLLLTIIITLVILLLVRLS